MEYERSRKEVSGTITMRGEEERAFFRGGRGSIKGGGV